MALEAVPLHLGIFLGFLKGFKMKHYIIPIIQTILCLAVWAYIGFLLAWRG